MTNRTTVSVNVHVHEETILEAELITNFVALKVGPDVDLFLMTSEDASRLAEAAEAAYVILRKKEGYLTIPTHADDMFNASKAWNKSIGYTGGFDISSSLGWDLADWDVVLRRAGYLFVVTEKMIAQYRAQYDRTKA